MKLKHILESQILVPRRSKEERSQSLAVAHYKKLQKYIKDGSKGDLDLGRTPLKTLPPNLVKVGGYINLENSQITSLNNLKHVEGNLHLSDSKVVSLGNLEHVGGHLYLNFSPITSFDNLKYVGGDLWLWGTSISNEYSKEQIRKLVNVKGLLFYKL